MRRSRFTLVLTGVAVGAATLAGCGSGSSPGGSGKVATRPVTPAQTLQAAYTTTVGQKSARTALQEKIGVAGHSITLTGTGVVDFVHKATDLTTHVGGQAIEIRTLGTVLYEKLPPMVRKALPGGKPWISLDLNTLSKKAFGASLSSLQQSDQTDPSTILSYLQAVSANGVHRAGTQTIKGTPSTEYDLTVDLRKLAATKSGSAAQAITAIEKATGSSSYPMKVWIDSHGLVHQLQFAVSSAGSGTALGGASPSGTRTTVQATMQFFDYGTPVTVVAPPAAQRTDLTKLLERQVTSGGGAGTGDRASPGPPASA